MISEKINWQDSDIKPNAVDQRVADICVMYADQKAKSLFVEFDLKEDRAAVKANLELHGYLVSYDKKTIPRESGEGHYDIYGYIISW